MGGILYEVGYYMGDNLYPARNSNPKGFFENGEINSINESILIENSQYKQLKNIQIDKKYNIYNPGPGQYWLGYQPTLKDIDCQLDWLDEYVQRRYGSFKKAIEFHDRMNWY